MWVIIMVIRGINKGYFSKIYSQKQIKDKETTSASPGDTVDISSEAKELQRLVHDTMNLEDVRLDKVEDLKSQIETGKYHVPAKKIADALLRYTRWK